MKKKKLLIVVDYQNDFTVGSLGCRRLRPIEDTVAAKIEEYRAMGENAQIIFTMDTHDKDYLRTQEGRNLPIEHCIKGFDGWQLYGKVAALKSPEDLVFSKPILRLAGACGLPGVTRVTEYESVELAGVVTNICVISNMVLAKAAMPEVPIYVDTACVASNNDALGEAALAVMETMHVKVKR